ncbi:hypothetical protein [Wolbachia endosymbiont (group A) of Andrena hattorfiana]|uniref:hypothetical protein n=1 Tax=Wolbachia endosymbiont (group A) of Andrena hattorfiana TaxID=2953977 RepID=UPI0021F8277F|nr:hypothetical protein [Wolbachia endosymbiont (group A) of Andrena hattorfiana]
MTYNFSPYPRMDPCISARTACITDPRYHHNFDLRYHHSFDPCYHNRFDPRHDRFDPRHGGLDLNIQLPDFDLSIPPCPACPPCPSYPQPKPEPKPKEPVDLSKLSTRIDILTDDIVNARTELPTGLKSKECAAIIQGSENDLEIKGGKLVGNCYNNPECDACVKAINLSILEKQYAEPFMSTLESTVYVI